MMDAKALEQLLQANMQDAIVVVKSEDGHHFEALVVSPEFEGKSLVQRQRMVYAVVGELISSGAVHALQLKTVSPLEYQNSH